MADGAPDDGPDLFESDLIDLRGVDVGKVLAMEGSVLARSLARILEETVDHEQVHSAFQSFV